MLGNATLRYVGPESEEPPYDSAPPKFGATLPRRIRLVIVPPFTVR
jgi:hypothetical protein